MKASFMWYVANLDVCVDMNGTQGLGIPPVESYPFYLDLRDGVAPPAALRAHAW